MPECLFCRIVAGDTDAAVVWGDDDFVAFLDIRPLFKGHTLLVPREHVVTLPDLPAALRDPFLAAAQRLAAAMVEALGAQGSFVAMNNVVSQSVRTCTATSYPAPRATGCAASSGRARSTTTSRTGTPGRPVSLPG
jgi:histidine triad (HIT) family protein